MTLVEEKTIAGEDFRIIRINVDKFGEDIEVVCRHQEGQWQLHK